VVNIRPMHAPLPSHEITANQPSLLMLQFLAWVADRPRTHADVMEAWRSTCPRMTVWEDAIIDGLVCLENGGRRTVSLTQRGRAFLAPETAPTSPPKSRVLA
jgi:hypothetical protein